MQYIIYLLLLILLFLISPIISKSKVFNGLIVNEKMKPYYFKVLYYIEPFLNCDFGKAIDKSSILQLKHIYKHRSDVYFDFQKIIDSSNNSDFAYSFSWLLIFDFLNKYNPIISLPREESLALAYFKERNKSIILEEKNNIPEILWQYFNINKETL